MRSPTLRLALPYGHCVMIGAGIYVLVRGAAGQSGMRAPLALRLAALVMSCSASSFVVLGMRMPVSASEAGYVEGAFNRPWLTIRFQKIARPAQAFFYSGRVTVAGISTSIGLILAGSGCARTR